MQVGEERGRGRRGRPRLGRSRIQRKTNSSCSGRMERRAMQVGGGEVGREGMMGRNLQQKKMGPPEKGNEGEFCLRIIKLLLYTDLQ